MNLSIKAGKVFPRYLGFQKQPGLAGRTDHLQVENTGCNQEQHHHLKKQKIIMCADNLGVNGRLGTSRADLGP